MWNESCTSTDGKVQVSAYSISLLSPTVSNLLPFLFLVWLCSVTMMHRFVMKTIHFIFLSGIVVEYMVWPPEFCPRTQLYMAHEFTIKPIFSNDALFY